MKWQQGENKKYIIYLEKKRKEERKKWIASELLFLQFTLFCLPANTDISPLLFFLTFAFLVLPVVFTQSSEQYALCS